MTWAVLALAANVTVEGTVATPVSLELSAIVRPPAGAGDERLSATLCALPPVSVMVFGEKLIAAPTVTVTLAEA